MAAGGQDAARGPGAETSNAASATRLNPILVITSNLW